MPPLANEPVLIEVQHILDVVVRALGDDIAGAYLFGSAIAGGLRPDSDVDLLVLTHRTMSRQSREQLVAALMEVSGARAGRGPARNAEVTVVVLGDIAPWRHPARSDFIYGEWLRDDFEAGAVPAPTIDPDLTLMLATALQSHRALIGPGLAEFLPAIPHADIRRAMADSLPGLVANVRGDERNVMLTLARMSVTLATGNIVPKDVAADWLLPRLPPERRALLATARDAYRGHVADEAWHECRADVSEWVSEVSQAIARTIDGSVKA
ncbi:aminoglycoside nucleotidyltransferase ANT(3'')-Ib [Cupriavidus sp. H18C1]|uniref:aminoglycoside nucleotidyltransferase ANT(3'')-Ib n=1 Tax=Cupriavidus sp. H18C1 TaxID=3241601 RepID=UPI003BB860C5